MALQMNEEKGRPEKESMSRYFSPLTRVQPAAHLSKLWFSGGTAWSWFHPTCCSCLYQLALCNHFRVSSKIAAFSFFQTWELPLSPAYNLERLFLLQKKSRRLITLVSLTIHSVLPVIMIYPRNNSRYSRSI